METQSHVTEEIEDTDLNIEDKSDVHSESDDENCVLGIRFPKKDYSVMNNMVFENPKEFGIGLNKPRFQKRVKSIWDDCDKRNRKDMTDLLTENEWKFIQTSPPREEEIMEELRHHIRIGDIIPSEVK